MSTYPDLTSTTQTTQTTAGLKVVHKSELPHLVSGDPGHSVQLLDMAKEHATQKGHDMSTWRPIEHGDLSRCIGCGDHVVVHHSSAGGIYGGPALSTTCQVPSASSHYRNAPHPHTASPASATSTEQEHYARLRDIVATIKAGNPEVEEMHAVQIALHVARLQDRAAALKQADYTYPDYHLPCFGEDHDEAGKLKEKAVGALNTATNVLTVSTMAKTLPNVLPH